MRKLYGSTNWRRLLALVLVFAMLFSAMGTSGYSVFADSQDETGEAVYAAEPEVVTPEVTEDVQGPSPGEDAEEAAEAPELTEDAEAEAAEEDSEETVEAEAEEGEEPEESEAVEEGEEIAEPAEEAEEGAEIAEPAEEAEEDEEIAEPAEEAEEDEEIAEPAEEIAEEEEPAEVALVEAEEPAAVSIVEEFKNGLAEELAAPSEEVVEPVEAAEEAEPAEEPEIAYPAWIDVKGFINGTTVTINAEAGTFPEGTEMVLSEVNTADIWDTVADALDAPVVKMRAIDITFVYEGEEIQPLKPISVKMNASGYDADMDRAVVHIDDKGEADVVKGVDTSEKAVEFEADSFSVYVLVESEVPRLTLKFMNGATEVATMIVKAEDTNEVSQIIYDPGLGVTLPAGQVFKGWTTDEEYTTASDVSNINDIRQDAMETVSKLSADDTVTYYAAIFKQFTVKYIDAKGISVGSGVAEAPIRDSSAVYTVNQGYTTDNDHNFMGWIVVSGDTNIVGYPGNAQQDTIEGQRVYYYPNGTEITIKGDIKFSVNAPEGHWLVFDANGKGGTYNAPRFVKAEDVTSDENLLEMKKKGYTFLGWYTGAPTEEGGDPTGEEFEFGHPLTEATTIYAKWKSDEEAKYTVIIWRQKVTSAGKENPDKKTDYDFVTSYVGTGTVGSSIKEKEISVGTIGDLTYVTLGQDDEAKAFGGIKSVANGTVTDPLAGFTLSSQDIEDATINAEGTAMVNIYFDRMQYTLKLYVTRTNQNGTGGFAGSSATGNTYAGNWNTNLTRITSVNGAVPTEYDTVEGENNRYYYYPITAYYGQSITTWPSYETINSSTAFVSWLIMHTAKGYRGSGNGRDTLKGEITVMDEQILGDLSDVDGNYATARYGSSNTWHYYIYFADANGNYPDVDHPSKTIEVRSAQTSASSQSAPTYDGYVYVPEKTVHNSNPLYMRYYYKPAEYSILYLDGKYVDGRNNDIKGQADLGELGVESNIPYGADISSHEAYRPDSDHTPEGFVFEGWFTDKDCNHKYEFETMPHGGVTLYAKWRIIEYRVFLHPNAYVDGRKDSSLSWGDENATDKQQMSFRRAFGDKISLPTGTRDGYEFYGWYTDENCSVAYAPATVMNDSTVTTPYNKDKSTELDPWGEPTNNTNADKDGNRFWITREFNLYALWSAITIGADGIGVTYDVGDGSNEPLDTTLYKDSAKVSTGAAPTAPAKYVFDHWALQTWNGESYVDTSTEILAGETFTILKKDARITDAVTEALVDPDDVVKDGKYKYTVQLRAVYKPVGEKTPTHIAWYSNYGSENGGKGELYRYDIKDEEGKDVLTINGGVTIYPAPSRPGYTFLGWTKTQGGTTADFLVWDGEKYTATINGKTVTATEVAADQRPNIEDLFAVWNEAEVTINYAVASDSTNMGTVALNKEGSTEPSEKVYAFSGKHEDDSAIYGGKATAASADYVFDYWTCDKQAAASDADKISTSAEFVPGRNSSDAYEAHTYYAHFVPLPDMATVTIHHYLKGTEIPVAESEEREVEVGTSIILSDISVATTFLEEFDGYTLVKSGTDPDPEEQDSVDVTDDGAVIIVYYTLSVTVSVKDKSAVYSGSSQFGHGQTIDENVTIKGLLEGDSIADLKYTAATGTNVGPYFGSFSADADPTVMNGDKETVSYYTFAKTAGQLSITARPVTFTGDSLETTYTGKEIELTGVTPSSGENEGLVDRHEANVEYSVAGKEIGSYTGTITAAEDVVIMAGEVDVTENYAITTKPGTLKITGEGYISINKEVTSKPKNGTKYVLGETIEYKITVKNEGKTVAVNDITVVDKMTGEKWVFNLAAQEVKELIPTPHVVTEEDILAGVVLNEAAIAPTTPDDPTPPGTPDDPDVPFTPDPPIEVIVEIEAPRAGLSITKEAVSNPALSEGYALNETVKYQITVQNTGNVTLTNVTVTDTKLKKQTWTVGTYDEELETYTFAPGATYTLPEMDTTYIVAEADVTAGEIVNVATVTGKGPAVEGLDGVVTVYDPDPATDTETVPTTAKTPVKTLKVAFYTNYPDEVLEKGWINEYSATKEVPTPYEVPGFVTVFDASMIPDGFKTESWEVHKPAKASGGTNNVVNADEDTVNENGMASTSSSSNGTKITEEPSDVDIIFYALWEEDYRFVPSGGTHPPKDPDPDPDDPDPDDEPDPDIPDPDVPLSPYEEEDEIPDEDTPFSDYEEEPDEELDEEPTPLSPYTGDDRHTAVWGFVSLMSLAGIAVLGRKRREEEE